VGRAAAIAAIALAGIAAVVLVLSSGGQGYHVNFLFQNAAQLVKGNLVTVSGQQIGKVEDLSLSPDGQAKVRASIDSDFAPLRQGTKAVIRVTSLSSIANRYIELQLAPASAPAVPNGGTINQADTTTAVDLDQLFNTFGPRERRGLQGVIRGFAQLYSGRQRQTNRAFAYVNPSVAASTRLFRELTFDEPGLRSFINQTARLTSDIDERRDDLAALVQNLEQTTGAIGRRSTELESAIRQLPDFMRRTNTTFVNLRATLDDLTPLVEESKPVARKLRPFLAQLRPLARDARPTLRDLSVMISQPGPRNDLIEATASNVPVRDIAIGPVRENGQNRRGAFPETTDALQDATPELKFARPYVPELEAWFDDFSHPGYFDALGAVGRVGSQFNAFAIESSGEKTQVPPPGCSPALAALCGLPLPALESLAQLPAIALGIPVIGPTLAQLGLIDPDIRKNIFNRVTDDQDNRCPGSAERHSDGSNPFTPGPVDPDEPGGCARHQMPPGK
jgi:phospholipid/cholesterol/gamma-HCH transport system substrate-binding protein